MYKLNEEDHTGEKRKIIDWKSRTDICTIVGGEKACNNRIEVFVDGEFDVEKNYKD